MPSLSDESLAGGIPLGPLGSGESDTASRLVARAMLDSPNAIAALGSNSRLRQKRLQVLFGARMEQELATVCARVAGNLVAVAAMDQPRGITRSWYARFRSSLMLAPMGPVTAWKLRRWSMIWARHEPTEPHWHIGPVAVEPALQGRGIGTRLMEECCRTIDKAPALAYLETDKTENVRFYQRLGFDVIAEDEVLGQLNWFMARKPCA